MATLTVEIGGRMEKVEIPRDLRRYSRKRKKRIKKKITKLKQELENEGRTFILTDLLTLVDAASFKI